MRYRKLSPTGDYVFAGTSPFLVNTPETVAQAILTRVRLYVNEWFIDTRIGLDKSKILGFGTTETRDPEIQQRILGTEGVLSLLSYSSSLDEERRFTVAARVDTIYGPTDIEANF